MPEFPKDQVAAVERVAEELGIELLSAAPTPNASASWIPDGKSYAGAQMEVVLEEEVPVFASGLGSPGPFAEELKANGATILALVGNVRAAAQVAHDGATSSWHREPRRAATPVASERSRSCPR